MRIVLITILLSLCYTHMLFSETSGFDGALEKAGPKGAYCVYVKEIGGKTVYRSDLSNIGQEPIPLGSVIKIFSIIAKYKNHPVNPDESYFCEGWGKDPGAVSRCWLKKGHGRISLINAVAHSCNTYFYHFVQDIDFTLFVRTLREWGLVGGSENWGRSALYKDDQTRAMIGKLNIVKVKPLDLMTSCDKMFGSASGLPIEVKDILTEGMSLCYREGTAGAMREKLEMPMDLPVVCKTGTGMYEDRERDFYSKTTGVFIGVYGGKYLVLAVAKNSTGADAASRIGLSLIKYLADGK